VHLLEASSCSEASRELDSSTALCITTAVRQQMSQRASSAAVPDGTSDKPKTTPVFLSDSTRPRTSRASVTSAVAGSLLASSAGAAGAGSTAATAGLRQPGSSSASSRTGRQPSSSIQQPAANGCAAAAGSRRPNAAGALAPAQEARQKQAAITPAAAVAGTPSTPLLQPNGSNTSSAYLQSNALFGQDHSSMTPSVRHKEYTPSLSPDMEQLAAASAAAAGRVTPAAACGLPSMPLSSNGLQQQQGAAAAGVQQVWAPAAALPAVCKAPKAYLQTTGDLFAAPDQDTEVSPVAAYSLFVLCTAVARNMCSDPQAAQCLQLLSVAVLQPHFSCFLCCVRCRIAEQALYV
jgi:hypothetical protein